MKRFTEKHRGGNRYQHPAESDTRHHPKKLKKRAIESIKNGKRFLSIYDCRF
ncbi:MAG: hypothetical protein LC136_10230 [Burkholderiales bacterium]|nr:hypothetical protein [Burkholderiales bacterium]